MPVGCFVLIQLRHVTANTLRAPSFFRIPDDIDFDDGLQAVVAGEQAMNMAFGLKAKQPMNSGQKKKTPPHNKEATARVILEKGGDYLAAQK